MQGFEHGTAALSMDTSRTEKFYLPRGSISFGTRLRGLIGLSILWHQRWQQRQHLSGLDTHLLQDIGVASREAIREAGKPFWRA